ncbi:hypothetical protein QTN25_000806 [Entamoeba marina]
MLLSKLLLKLSNRTSVKFLTSQEELELSSLDLLVKWSGLQCEQILFDSDKDETSNTSFYRAIQDEFDNIFGFYIDEPVTKPNDCYFSKDSRVFLFSLICTSGTVKKPTIWNSNKQQPNVISVWKNDNCLYGVGEGGWIAVHKPNLKTSRFVTIHKAFNGVKENEVNGTCCSIFDDSDSKRFQTERIVILQMAEKKQDDK